jgi:hypothetical protein
MALKFNKGDKVKWSWGNGDAEGKVTETFKEKVTRTISGNEVTRNADDDNPAYLVEQEDGSRALKSESELSKP